MVMSKCFFGSNVPLILLINPCKFEKFAPQGNASQKTDHIWAKIG